MIQEADCLGPTWCLPAQQYIIQMFSLIHAIPQMLVGISFP